MEKFLICHRGALGDLILALPTVYALRQTSNIPYFLGIGRPEYMRLVIDMGIIDSFYDAESSEILDFFKGVMLPERPEGIKGGVLWLSDADAIRRLLGCSVSSPILILPPIPKNGMHIARYHYVSVQSVYPLPPYEPSSIYFTLETAHKTDRIVDNNQERSTNLKIKTPQPKTYCLIHPGSGSPGKNYPPAFYFDLVSLLEHHGFTDIRIIIGPAELRMMDYFSNYKDKGKCKRIPVIEMPEDVLSLARLLAKAVLYIGNDSGVSHLSGVLSTPTIALYRITDPEIWGILGKRVWHVRASSEDVALKGVGSILKEKGLHILS